MTLDKFASYLCIDHIDCMYNFTHVCGVIIHLGIERLTAKSREVSKMRYMGLDLPIFCEI